MCIWVAGWREKGKRKLLTVALLFRWRENVMIRYNLFEVNDQFDVSFSDTIILNVFYSPDHISP